MSKFAKLLLHKPSDQRGVVLITILVVGMIVTFVGLSLADLTISQYTRTNGNVFRTNALLTAEAGIERTLQEINTTNGFSGYTTEQGFFNNDSQGRATYTSAVTTGTSGNERVITATGKVYRKNTDKLEATRSVKVTIVGTTSEGYSVYAGSGGLIMSGSASITNSDINVNGTIKQTGAASIGTQANPVKVNVAYQSCPTGTNPGPTFPQVCTTGEPISFETSTRIYGEVCATRQTSTRMGTWQTQHSIQGLISGCTAQPVTMPPYDRDAHIARMTTTGNPSNATYNCSTWTSPNGFTRTWPANLRLNGNVDISSSCDLTITGDVYITGNLTMGGSAAIKVANTAGGRRPVIIVDGTISAAGSSRILPNSSGTAMHFISYKSTAPCSPSCTSVAGTNLRTSQDLTTIDVGGSGNYPGAIFQGYWSKVKLGGSGTMGAAVGQTVETSGSGNMVFGTTLSSGESTWTIRSYQQIFQ